VSRRIWSTIGRLLEPEDLRTVASLASESGVTNLNRRGFLRLAGIGAAAGLAAPTLDKLDFLARNPTSILVPSYQTPYYIKIDAKNKSIRYVYDRVKYVTRRSDQLLWPVKSNTVSGLAQAVSEAFDHPDMIAEPSPIMSPISPHELTMINSWSITEDSMKFLKEGAIVQGDQIWQSLSTRGKPFVGIDT